MEDERVEITIADKESSGSDILGDFFSFEVVEKLNEFLEELHSPITQVFSKLPQINIFTAIKLYRGLDLKVLLIIITIFDSSSITVSIRLLEGILQISLMINWNQRKDHFIKPKRNELEGQIFLIILL